MDEAFSQPAAEMGAADAAAHAGQHADVRAQRIGDYAREALDDGDSLAANVGVITADLMELAYLFKQLLGESLEQPPQSVREMADVLPAVDQYLKVTKQINTLTQLTIKLKKQHNGEQP